MSVGAATSATGLKFEKNFRRLSVAKKGVSAKSVVQTDGPHREILKNSGLAHESVALEEASDR